MYKNKASIILGVMALGMSVVATATPILTQTAQGNYQNNLLNGSRWTDFTSMVNTSNTITETGNFENLATLMSYDAVWVDQEYGNTLSATEVSNLQNFYNSNDAEVLVILDSNWNDNSYLSRADNISFAQNIVDWLADTSVDKMVLIGENNLWNSWNQSILDIVGGGFNSECSGGVGTSTSSHSLTGGVSSVENICGSTVLSGLGNPDMLFSNNMAAIYNRSSTVPEPSVIALFGLGLAGIGFARRRKA